MKSKMRRIYAAVMALAITISLVTVPVRLRKRRSSATWTATGGKRPSYAGLTMGVIEGSNGQFNPDAPITRAEMAAVIARLLGLTETAENTFTDVEAGAWYAQAILQCAAAGIIQGSNGMANPQRHPDAAGGRRHAGPGPWASSLTRATWPSWTGSRWPTGPPATSPS